MYEELRKEVDWEHQHPDGAVFHRVHLMILATFVRLISGNHKSI